MGIGNENLQVEGIKHTRVLALDNIKVNLQEIRKRNFDFTQDSDR